MRIIPNCCRRYRSHENKAPEKAEQETSSTHFAVGLFIILTTKFIILTTQKKGNLMDVGFSITNRSGARLPHGGMSMKMRVYLCPPC